MANLYVNLDFYFAQPLHTGFPGDLGGNTIILNWYHNQTNLHRVSVLLLIILIGAEKKGFFA